MVCKADVRLDGQRWVSPTSFVVIDYGMVQKLTAENKNQVIQNPLLIFWVLIVPSCLNVVIANE